MNDFMSAAISLSRLKNAKTRSMSPENFTGEKGAGGMSTDGAAKHAARELGRGWKVSPYVEIKPGEVFELGHIYGEGGIKHIWITDSAEYNRSFVIRMYWDGSDTPSVEVPLGDFFASATYKQYAPISSLAVCVNTKTGLNCYWDMPFRKEAKITLENLTDKVQCVYYQIDYVLEELPENIGYFHAQFRRSNPLKYMDVHTVLDGVSGKGHYVGTYMLWGSNNSGWWGEGEMKFYLDGDEEFPTICGTGTEDYFCGSYSFASNGEYVYYTNPYTGFHAVKPQGSFKTQPRFSMYRWHITDPIYFDENIRITCQALGWRNDLSRYLPLQDDISSVAYWYQDSICKNFPALPDRNELELI